MFRASNQQGSSSSTAASTPATDYTRFPANATICALGCMRHKKDLGSNRFIFTFMFHITDNSVGAWNTGIVSFFNLGGAVELPDNDAEGTVAMVIGKIAFMNPDCIDLAITNNDAHGVYANLSNFDVFIEAEKVFPLTSAASPPTSFSPTQPPIIFLGGMATNVNRTSKPNSFAMDIEVYMNSTKKASDGTVTKPVFPIRAIFSANGPYKKTQSPPVPYNKKCVMLTGTLVGIEYDKSRTRANGVAMAARYILDITHISFMGATSENAKVPSAIPFPNTLDGTTATSSSTSTTSTGPSFPTSPFSSNAHVGTSTTTSTSSMFPAFGTGAGPSSSAVSTSAEPSSAGVGTGTGGAGAATEGASPGAAPPVQGDPMANGMHPPSFFPPPHGQTGYPLPPGYYAPPQYQPGVSGHMQGMMGQPMMHPQGYAPAPYSYFQSPHFGGAGYPGAYHHAAPTPAPAPPTQPGAFFAPGPGPAVQPSPPPSDDPGLEYVDPEPPTNTLIGPARPSTATTATSATSSATTPASSGYSSNWGAGPSNRPASGALGKHPATDPPHPPSSEEPASKKAKPTPNPVPRPATRNSKAAASTASAAAEAPAPAPAA